MPDSIPGSSVPVLGSAAIPIPESTQPTFGPWRDRAVCAGEDPEIFFPVFGDPAIEARRLCANCPVRPACLQYGTAADEYGVWGGLDREQRRALTLSRENRDETAVPNKEGELA